MKKKDIQYLKFIRAQIEEKAKQTNTEETFAIVNAWLTQLIKQGEK